MRTILLILGFGMLAFQSTAQETAPFFLSHPCLSPDGQTVFFSFEGDLWKADLKQGRASRITAMQGYETSPRVSPDGKWIAFTGRQFGNADIFVMPVEGGDIKQLTYHSGLDEVNSWSWDSKQVLFHSNRAGLPSGFKINISGGTPERIMGNHFFQYDHNLFMHPTTGEIFFNDTWESLIQVHRKRYKGPYNPEIQSYNPVTKQYKKYTNWEGKDMGATIDKNGNLYFISDQANGEYNLYSMAGGNKTPLTNFNSSIKTPQVNANGGKIIFEKDYQLWIYDVGARRSEKLNISIVRNAVLPKEKDYDVKGKISNFDISPDGKKMAFTSRGEIFVSDVEAKFIQQIKKGSAERAQEVKWLSDNRTLVFSQTLNGYLNWYTISADGKGSLKQLTNDKSDNRQLVLNKKRTKGVYLSGREEVRMIDLKTMQHSLLVQDEIWGFFTSTPAFSPDERYILFTAYRGFEEDILLYNLETKKTVNLTNTGVTETNPAWSADGKYIYFSSSRLKPSYPFGSQNSRVYRLPLEKLDEPYRSDKFNDLFKEEKKDTTKKNPPATDSAFVKLDMDQILERMQQVSPSMGTQILVAVNQKGDKSNILYASDHGEGKYALWKTVIEPFEENKTEKIAGTDGTGDFDILSVGDKSYLLSRGTISKLNLESNKAEPINTSYTFRRNMQDEFSQMFEEAWAKMEMNYYDKNFHGLNWAATKAKYQPFIAGLNNRADMRILLNDMLGELNSSHQGFNTFGDEETIGLPNRTMETGIIFNNNDPYRVVSVLKRSSADRKGMDILPGDVLVSVNDEQVKAATDRNYYFSKPSIDREIKLGFNRNGKVFDVKLHPQPSLFANLYDEWIDVNQQRVDSKSNNRIAYSCMKDMGTPELEKFIIDMTQELNSKDALILDLRYNTGGNVHDEVLKFLSQRSYLEWKYREGKATRQGNFTPSDKPIVLLINEQSLSDAEMTAAGFKELKLGKIIGNETYRWIIFTGGAGLVDGSSLRMPSWGCFTIDGKDLEMAGVQPDIKVINSFEDKINGRDPQLDRAIEEIMKSLKNK